MKFQNGFEAGELDKWCLGRVDDPAYQRGLAWLENFNLMRQGGINRRKGYKRMARILEIREPEYRTLDRSDGAEEYRDTDAEKPEQGQSLRRVDTKFGTASSLVKLIPLAYENGRTYLVYILPQKYGVLRFRGYEMDGEAEHDWPPAPSVPAKNVFPFNSNDPDAHWKIADGGIGELASQADIADGAVLDIGGNPPAQVTVSADTASLSGKLETVRSFDIVPVVALSSAVLPQGKGAMSTLGYFDEIGAGTGLRANCSVSVQGNEATLSFQVLDGGSGFEADTGKDTTTLELKIENVGTVKVSAIVGAGGAIQSISDYRVRNYPAEGTGNAVMRFNAPPPPDGAYSDVYDFYGNKPLEAPTLNIKTEKTAGGDNDLGDSYSITVEPEPGKAGQGFKPLCDDALGRPIAFLKIIFISDIGGTLCERELRIVAVLDSAGGIVSVKDIPFWIDDGIAAYAPPAGTPGAEGDCFSRIMSGAWFNKPYGTYEDASVAFAFEDGEEGRVFTNPDGLPPPVKHIVNISNKNEYEAKHEWKGPSMDNYGYGNQKENSRNQSFMNGLLGTGPVMVLQEFAGTWYGKTLGLGGSARLYHEYKPHGDSCGCGWIGVTPPAYYQSFPLAHRTQVIGENKTGASFYEFDSTMAGCCPKSISDIAFSAQPSLEWFVDGRQFTAPYANALQKYVSGTGAYWFLAPVSDKRNNTVPSAVMFSAFQDTVAGTFLVSESGALKGGGAEINAVPYYLRPDAEHGTGQAVFRLTVNNDSAKDYLVRQVPGIKLYLYPDGAGGFAYEIPVNARRGSGGTLVLDEQDGSAGKSGTVLYTVPAVLKTEPPANGGTAILSDADGHSASAKCAVSPVTDSGGSILKWTVGMKIPVAPNGEPYSEAGFEKDEALSAQWTVNNRTFTAEGERNGKLSAVAVFAVKSYTAVLKSAGKFKANPAGADNVGVLYHGSHNGQPYDIKIKKGEFVSEKTLAHDAEPGAGLFKVSTDEESGGNTTYWTWDAVKNEFKPAAVNTYPQTDAAVAALQYAYTGAYFILCGYGMTPFALEIKTGTLDIEISQLYANPYADVEVVAPKEFGLSPQNRIRDAALPDLFLTAGAASPSAVAYINGRLWVAGLPDDPGRVFVSKPNRDRNSRTFDFSTYRIFETVTPVLTPFQADNDMNSNLLGSVSDGAMGLAAAYNSNPVTGGKISFGNDRAAILATPYFANGAEVVSVSEGLSLSAQSVPLANEYTERAAAQLRNKAAFYIGMCRLRVSIPGVCCGVTADCDGFEVRVATSTQWVGVTSSVGPSSSSSLAVGYTAWGNGLNRAGVIAAAVGMAATMCGGAVISMASVGGSVLAILLAAAAAVDGIITAMINSLSLDLTNGGAQSPGLEEFGAEYPTTSAIQLKCDYLLAKNKLYEPKQPFVMRRWKVEESEYSTADCGFTFKAASDEPEGISFIADMRSVFLSTESSERILPATVNGAEQSMQTGSFFGAQRTQPAKAADALYFVRKGGQALMRAAYAPNVPVPQITDAQMYNREILRGRKILGIRSSKAQPPCIWCVTDDGKPAVFAETGGAGAWMRVSSGAGEIIDTGAVPSGGAGTARIVAVRAADGIYIGIASEDLGEKGDVFLDLWSEYANGSVAAQYGPGAAVYDSVTGETVPAEAQPEPGPGKYIGYPYESRFRTLPGNSAMSLSPSRVAAARFRLLESHLPYIKGYPGGMVNRMVHPLWAGSLDVAKDGVVAVPVPGGIEQDAAYEVFTSVPAPLSVVCMIAEED